MSVKDKDSNNNSTKNYKNGRAGRRSIIKGLAAGGTVAAGFKALPDAWTTPVVDAVVLPAHAQLSLRDPCDIVVEVDGNDLVFQVSGNVEGSGDLGGLDVDIEVELLFNGTPTGNTQQQNNLTTNPDGSYGPVTFTFTDGCDEIANGAQATVTSDSPGLGGQQGSCPTSFQKGCGKPGP